MSKEDIKLGADKYFSGYRSSDPAGCHRRCVDILTNHGLQEFGSKEYVYKLLYEKDGKYVYFGDNPTESYEIAIGCIDRHLENGRPIIIGVSHTIGLTYNPDRTTDHYIVIHGREKVGEYWDYLYYETGNTYPIKGHNNETNRLRYDPTGNNGLPVFYDVTANIKGGKRFDVTHVRPNDGYVAGTVPLSAQSESEGTLLEYIEVNTDIVEGGSGSGSGSGSQNSNEVSQLGNSDPNGGSSDYSGGGESYDSFGLSTIFGKIFPEDDNNRYINMPSEEIEIVQYSEPVLKVEELNISNRTYASYGVNPEKVSYYTPVVYINDFMIPQTNITNFCLDYTSFVPQVMVEFVDMTNEMLSTNVPKPGSYIKVFIGGHGDEKYYKPIRQDFVITNVNKTNRTGGEYQNYGRPFKYKLTGILNVPLGIRKMPWSSSKINARQAMFNVSNTVGLGFATNFNTNSDVDVMRWINTQNKSYFDFMKDITLHSCYSPYTFFTSFIDQYYVLNYVECHRLLSHSGKKTDLPQVIYSTIMPEMSEKKSEDEEETNDVVETADQKVSYYVLTNNEEFRGWSNYIEEYFELNDGYGIMSDGYRKYLTYSDKCGFPDISSKNYKFTISPIDNLERDDYKNIKSLPDSVTYDTYIPLNLRQTTSTAYTDSQAIYDNPIAAESSVDLGEVDTSNAFPLYFYAAVQNDFQMKNLKKCGLSVRLQNYNPSITRYSRIWVDIYDMHNNSTAQIRKNSNVDKMPESKVKDYFKKKNDNIIAYDEDMVDDNELQVYNRSLSGWYVVTDMKIIFNSVKDFKGVMYKKLQTIVTLNRIEYKPTFHSEYEMAKKAIEKYKFDNIAENIICGVD